MSEPGEHVTSEIASQPQCWATALRGAEHAARLLPEPGERVAVIGCGTSLHLATAIAAAREAAGMGETDAFTASELPPRDYDTLVAVTRSGTTTEVLDAVRRSPPGIRRVVVTTDPDTPIAQLADDVLVLDYADEVSVVQTRFATTVLTVFRSLVGHDLAPVIEQASQAIEAELEEHLIDRSHVVFLGRGWSCGIAAEAALKVREAAAAWSESYAALEYRHGPLSAATPDSLIWLLGVDDDALVGDIAASGATVVVGRLDPQAELVVAQRVAVATALRRGLDPDHPRNLTRSVVLT